MLKPFLLEDSRDTIKPIAGQKKVHTFPKSNYQKVNLIAWLELELAYLRSTGAAEYSDCFSAEE